jgi:hypothetical protein
MLNQLHTGKAKHSSIFNYPTLTWPILVQLLAGGHIMNRSTVQSILWSMCKSNGKNLQGRKLSPAPGLKFIGVE